MVLQGGLVQAKLGDIDLTTTEEFRVLQVKFSSGVTLRELTSIARILSLLAGIPEPPRTCKRSFPNLIKWFIANWQRVSPFLPCVQLRDDNNEIIDGRRELIEKGYLKQ